MDEIQRTINEVAVRTARIETHIEYQIDQFERIEKALVSLEATKAKVHSHDIQIKGFSWFIGVIISFFTLKFFGKF